MAEPSLIHIQMLIIHNRAMSRLVNDYRVVAVFGTCAVSHGVMRSAASSYAAMHMVAGSRPVFIIAWEWHIGLALLCGCSGALEYPTTNSCWPINKSLSLSLSVNVCLYVNIGALEVCCNIYKISTPATFDCFSKRIFSAIGACAKKRINTVSSSLCVLYSVNEAVCGCMSMCVYSRAAYVTLLNSVLYFIMDKNSIS